MPTSFPEIEPTDRSFNAPRWPTSSDTTKSGAITRRLWGSRPNSGQLSLKFQNTTDANAAAILAAYDNAKGSVDSLTLPDILFNGANANLKAWLDGSAHGAGLLWCFTEGSPPQVESIAPGRSTVTVSLTAELRTPSSPVAPANGVGVWYVASTAVDRGTTFNEYRAVEIGEPYVIQGGTYDGQLYENRIVSIAQLADPNDVSDYTPNDGSTVFFQARDRTLAAKNNSYWSSCDEGFNPVNSTSSGSLQLALYRDGIYQSSLITIGALNALTINCEYRFASETTTLTYIGPGTINDWYSGSVGFTCNNYGISRVCFSTTPFSPDLPGPS